MPIYQKFKTTWKRRDTLVAFFMLCLCISFLSFQFGRSQLSNEGNPNFVEQDKIIYPILAGLLTLIVPLLINAYMDHEVQQEVKKAKIKAIEDVYNDETSDGIRAKQELELVASLVIDELQSIPSLINSKALLPKVKQEIDKAESKDKLKGMKQDANDRYETVAILLSKSDTGAEVAETLARTATLDFFDISQDEMSKDPKAQTFCKDLYKCTRAWLVCSLRNGRYMPVEVLQLSYPNESNNYKDAIRLIYEDIISREDAKKYFKTKASRIIMKKYLEFFISKL